MWNPCKYPYEAYGFACETHVIASVKPVQMSMWNIWDVHVKPMV